MAADALPTTAAEPPPPPVKTRFENLSSLTLSAAASLAGRLLSSANVANPSMVRASMPAS
jgi:hypothetical protein